jgi:hypothetical protein
MNMDFLLYRNFSHMIIMIRKSGSTLKVKEQRFNKRKFYQSDRLALRLRKSLTDNGNKQDCSNNTNNSNKTRICALNIIHINNINKAATILTDTGTATKCSNNNISNNSINNRYTRKKILTTAKVLKAVAPTTK